MNGSDKINIFSAIYKSLVDFKSYRIFKEKSMGSAFLYILILTIIFGSIQSISIARSIEDAFSDMKKSLDKDFPEFTITERGLDVKGKMPIISESKDFFYAIDTTGQIDSSILKKYPKGILVTKDKIYYKKNIFEIREYDIDSLKQFAPITKATVMTFLSYSWIVVVITIPFYLIYFYVSKIFSSFVISILGLILKGIVKSNAEFAEIFKLSFYALTLPVIIKAATIYFSAEIPHFFLLYYGVGTAYLLAGLKTLKAE